MIKKRFSKRIKDALSVNNSMILADCYSGDTLTRLHGNYQEPQPHKTKASLLLNVFTGHKSRGADLLILLDRLYTESLKVIN